MITNPALPEYYIGSTWGNHFKKGKFESILASLFPTVRDKYSISSGIPTSIDSLEDWLRRTKYVSGLSSSGSPDPVVMTHEQRRGDAQHITILLPSFPDLYTRAP